MNPQEAEKLYEDFNHLLESEYQIPVQSGVLGLTWNFRLFATVR